MVWMINGLLISYVGQTATQIYVGYLGDQPSSSSFGRRKPYVVMGYVLKAVSFFLLTIPPSKDADVLSVWFVVFYTLNAMSDAISGFPYESWLIESSRDNADYMRLKSIIFPIALFAGGVTAIVLFIYSPILCAVTYAVGTGVCLILLIYRVPNNVVRAVEKLPDLIPSVRLAMRTLEFRQLFANNVIFSVAVGLYFAATNFLLLIGFDTIKTMDEYVQYALVMGLIAGIVGVLATIACNSVLKKIDKLWLYLQLIKIVGVIGVTSFLLSALSHSNVAFYVFLSLNLCVTIFYAPMSLIMSLFIRDLVTYDTFVTRMSRETLYLTALYTPSQIIVSFVSAIPTIILYFSGFDQNEDVDDDNVDGLFEWTEGSLWILRITGPLAMTLLASAAYFNLNKYHLTTQISDQMGESIRRRTKNSSSKEKNEISNMDAEDKDKIAIADQQEQQQLLLHLSPEELYALSRPGEGKNSRDICSDISMLSTTALACGATNVIIVVAAIFVDVVMGSSAYSTLLVSLFLVLTFYSMYEFFRHTVLSTISLWPNQELQDRAYVAFMTLTSYKETLKELVERNGLQDDTNAVKSICDEPSVLGESSNHIPGYKRICATMAVVFVGSVSLIVLQIVL